MNNKQTKLEMAIHEADAAIRRAMVVCAASKDKPSDMPYCRTCCDAVLLEASNLMTDALRWEEQMRTMIGSRSAGRKPAVKAEPVAVSG